MKKHKLVTPVLLLTIFSYFAGVSYTLKNEIVWGVFHLFMFVSAIFFVKRIDED